MANHTRKFDWDEAARLRAEGLSYAAIGRRLGVSASAVRLALNPDENARIAARASAWQANGICPDCGGPATRKKGTRTHPRNGRCRPCAARVRAKVQDGHAYCPTCDTWKPRADFRPVASRPARGVHSECRDCDRARRRAHRERENAAAREAAT